MKWLILLALSFYVGICAVVLEQVLSADGVEGRLIRGVTFGSKY